MGKTLALIEGEVLGDAIEKGSWTKDIALGLSGKGAQKGLLSQIIDILSPWKKPRQESLDPSLIFQKGS